MLTDTQVTNELSTLFTIVECLSILINSIRNMQYKDRILSSHLGSMLAKGMEFGPGFDLHYSNLPWLHAGGATSTTLGD